MIKLQEEKLLGIVDSAMNTNTSRRMYTKRIPKSINNYAMNKINTRAISGIYKITCKVNNKIYIGSAKDIKTRWVHHRSKLKHHKHNNPYLQKAYNKYGEVNFIWEIIEECSVNDLLLKEQYYIDMLRPFDDRGYNISVTASNPMMGRKHTLQTRIKQSEAGKDKTLHRCIIFDTKQVVYLTQYQIHHEWNIKDFAAFIRKPGHWTKKGLISFINIEFNSKLYNDWEVEQFLLDVKMVSHQKRSQSHLGRVGTFKGKKHTEKSKAKMRAFWAQKFKPSSNGL